MKEMEFMKRRVSKKSVLLNHLHCIKLLVFCHHSAFNFPPMSAEAQLTPMMAQYRRIKGELPKDALLLFRLGDFYEMFFEDAQAGAQIPQSRAHRAQRRADVRPAASRGQRLHRPHSSRPDAKSPSATNSKTPGPASSSNARSRKSFRPARISTNGCWSRSGIIFSPPI